MKYRQILSDTALTAGTLAGVVDAAYRYKESNEERQDESFHLVDKKHIGGSQAYLFKHTTDVYILTFPGTVLSSGADILVDFGFAIQGFMKSKSASIVMKRMHEALQAAGDLISKHNLNTENTVITGHSLGGAEARYVSGQTGIPAIVFAAPHHPSVDGNKPSKIVEFGVFGDLIDNVGTNNTTHHLRIASLNPLKNHSIETIERKLGKNFPIEEIIGDHSTMDGPQI